MSASKEIKQSIMNELKGDNVTFTNINSKLVSAQLRNRFYVTNFGYIEQPKDRGILLKDIATPCNERNDIRPLSSWVYGYRGDKQRISKLRTLQSPKASCLTTRKSHNEQYYLTDDKSAMFNLSINEWELLQTLPIDYTNYTSLTNRYKGVGNGWTAEVIKHLLDKPLKFVPRDTPLQVLSMYDGIATGMLVLKQMGFTNIEYHAFEIDESAIAIAQGNHPEIIQHGDAFKIRD